MVAVGKVASSKDRGQPLLPKAVWDGRTGQMAFESFHYENNWVCFWMLSCFCSRRVQTKRNNAFRPSVHRHKRRGKF
jgi:hypothetical protein